MSSRPFTGAVMAGGASRRMGQDKATLEFNGELLWQRQVRILREAGANPVGVVRRPDQAVLSLDASTPLWFDQASGIGPLAGLHAALVACQTEWLAVVATDMPHIDAEWFHWLLGYCRPGIGAITQQADGLFEPLAAIYPRAALASANQRLTAGPHSLQSLAMHLHQENQVTVVPLPANKSAQVANWNSPQDREKP